MRYLDVPFFKQDTDYRCGPTVLQMLFAYYGKEVSQDSLAEQLGTNEEVGTRHKALIEVATRHGMYCAVKNRATEEDLLSLLESNIPPIVHIIEKHSGWDHYSVVTGVSKTHIVLNDPENGANYLLSKKEIPTHWTSDTLGNHPQWFMAVSPQPIQIGKQYLPRTTETLAR